MAKRYKIHPSIGIARVGTSKEFYIGPELPGAFARSGDGRYRDADKKLRRQAASATSSGSGSSDSGDGQSGGGQSGGGR